MPNITSKDGCSLHPVCTECTETKCIYDRFRGALYANKRRRDEEVLEEWKKGKSIEELAETFYLKTNTIRFILRREFRRAKYSRLKG